MTWPRLIGLLGHQKSFVQGNGQHFQRPITTMGCIFVGEVNIDCTSMKNGCGNFQLWSPSILKRFWATSLGETWQSKLAAVHAVDYTAYNIFPVDSSPFVLCVGLPVTVNTRQMSHILVRKGGMCLNGFRMLDARFQTMTYHALGMVGHIPELELLPPRRNPQGSKKVDAEAADFPWAKDSA